MKEFIYLDNAATTVMYPEVLWAMEPYLTEEYGNPSAAYDLGDSARLAIEVSREKIASCIGAFPDEIFFTAGGTEADNWIIKTIGKQHIVTSNIEHHAVSKSCENMGKSGCKIDYISVDEEGIIDLGEVRNKINCKTDLLSVMYANNEIGTIQPVFELGNIARDKGCFFHTDAVQAVGHIPIDLGKLPIDFMSASGHKFHGPKGVGFLFARRDKEIYPFMHGGKQESGIRAGTENVAGIVGMATALEIATTDLEQKMMKISGLRDYFVQKVQIEIPDCIYNGHKNKRLPGNINLCFRNMDSQTILVLLDEAGICASAGSACNTGIRSVSHVIEAIGVPDDYKFGCVRFTMDENNTKEELDYLIRVLKKICKR